MKFLNPNDDNIRLKAQFEAFISDTYLDIVAILVDLPMFYLPKIRLTDPFIKEFSIPKNLRLGNRLERFFSYIINQSNDYELIAENLQIIEHKTTIGELDFILLDKTTNEINHVELATKIYLYDPEIDDELFRWIGPNKRDSLCRKTAKLKEKQFPLLYHPKTINLLDQQHINYKKISQKICFKARLFMPYKLKDDVPEYVMSKNIKGYYLKVYDFLAINHTDNKFFMPLKQDWMMDSIVNKIWFSFEEIRSVVQQEIDKKQSPFLWIKRADDQIESCFVVWW